jgi:hypothetical protein
MMATLADYCPGHESLRGALMGASSYCDGTCLQGDDLADALAELGDRLPERGDVEGPGDYAVSPR